MSDSGSLDQEAAMENAYRLVAAAMDEAQRLGMPLEAMASAMLDVAGQILVDEFGRDAAEEIFEEIAEDVRRGSFGPDANPQA